MRPGRIGAIVMLTAIAATTAVAQTNVGAQTEAGLPWHVAALQGASWSLECRFKPVVYEATSYNRNAWANRLQR